MGSLGDRHDETQPLDSHPPPLSVAGNNCKDKDFGHFLQSTSLFMETVPFDDGLETQVLNFEGETQVPSEDGLETQVMNFEGETQVLFEDGLETQVANFAGETQVLDDFDGFENIDTQLLDEWNNEEDKTDSEQSDKTDLLCDTDDLSDSDSVKIIGCSLVDRENTTISKQDEKSNKTELNASFYGQTNAGVKMDFTSVRVAALRASGVAARSKALNKSKSELCSIKNEHEFPKDHTSDDSSMTGIKASLVPAVEIDEGTLVDEQLKGTGEESKGKIVNSAVRQLFMDDDKLAENKGLNTDGLYEVGDVVLPVSNELVGLSYVDSQEPGDLSQANALDLVDKFLKSNDMDFAKEFDNVGSTVKKSKPVSSMKGTQSLARKSGLKSKSGGMEIYDWDDNREDEGGGEFSSRQKNAVFDDEGKGLAHSCSASKLLSSKRTVKKAKVAEVKKNLSKELDEQLNVDSLDGMKASGTETDLQDMFCVGPDTQMAAEAMEVLCLGLDVTSTESKDTNAIIKHTRKGSSKGGEEDKQMPKKYPLRKRSNSSSCEDLTRKSKKRNLSGMRELTVTFSKQSKSGREQHKNFDTSNLITPLGGQEQVHSCAPVASRTRQRSVRRQSINGNITFDTIIGMSYRKGRRGHRGLSHNGHVPVNQSAGQQRNEKPCQISSGSKNNSHSFSVDQGIRRKKRSALRVASVFPSSDRECQRDLCNQSGEKEGLEEVTLKCKLTDEKNSNLDASPVEISKSSILTSGSPASCTSSGVDASPICMGDEYLKQSCRMNLSRSLLVKEIDSLVSHGPEPTCTMKESRKRRDMANVRVLFSHHLDDDIIQHQKKILAKLGASVAPSISEATHFVTDKFVRTRNMLEAIAFGKPVVTPLWLESCEQASCCIDEKNYILRDTKKEKEFGFSLPTSLAHACQRPLLEGLKVWITPSTKPGVEILSSLVKAVHGLPVKRIGRSVLKDDKVPDDLLVLSCEEDYAVCLPFIEKGGAVFSSELLLNGIVTQKLEYERHRLFDDHVKKTRSTIWLKRDSNQYLPVAKCK